MRTSDVFWFLAFSLLCEVFDSLCILPVYFGLSFLQHLYNCSLYLSKIFFLIPSKASVSSLPELDGGRC